MNLTSFFIKLTTKLRLGNLLYDGVRVYGGFMHKMYKLDTDSGSYVVKLLNPNVMKRLDAMGNYVEADRLEKMVEKNNIPIIPSLVFDDCKMQEIDGQYFYIYQWYDGETLKRGDITQLHCEKISKVLCDIHQIEVRKETYQRNPINIDWDFYINLAKKQNQLIYDLLNRNKELLYESQNNGNKAIQMLPAVVTICHNDMDSKNVLWLNEDFKIIDLECLGYSNPYLELFELALCWSGYEECNINFKLFRTFVESYFKKIPKPDINWEAIYDSNYGRLLWLEFNVKRGLFMECDTREEQEIGIGQVKETIDHVIYYKDVKDRILNCFTTKSDN